MFINHLYFTFLRQFISLAFYLIGFFKFWGLSILSSLYILDINPLSDVCYLTLLKHSLGFKPLKIQSYNFCCEPSFNG